MGWWGRRVSFRDRDRLPYTGLLITKVNLFLIALKAKVLDQEPSWSVPARALFQVAGADFLFFSHMILFCPHNSFMTHKNTDHIKRALA